MSTTGQGSGASEARSSISRAFSADLNDAFSPDKSLDGLVQSVERKKQEVSSELQELEVLEAKLKATEEKLKEKQTSPAANRVKADAMQQQQSPQTANRAQTPEATTSSNAATAMEPTGSSANQAPSASTMSYWRPPMPGALPETPGDAHQKSYLGGQ
ncbi:MAG: hypothetical protein Q9168_002797 [Polycauliona sp. 1 TL-2023]